MSDYDEDEVAKVRIHENDDPRRDFSIGSSFDEEILYLRLPTEDVRRVRDWANHELDDWEDYDPNLLRSTASHRDRLEGAAESAVNDLRRIASGFDGAVGEEIATVATELELAVEGSGDLWNVDADERGEQA